MSGIVAAASLRPYLIDAVERGMRRTLNGPASNGHVMTLTSDPAPAAPEEIR
jgi:hypothetical protein